VRIKKYQRFISLTFYTGMAFRLHKVVLIRLNCVINNKGDNMKLFILLTALTTFCFSAYADNRNEKINSIVDEFYMLKTLKLVGQKHDCYPQGQSCFKTACTSVRVYECDDQNEMNLLRRACRGVWGDSCIKTAFNYLHQFEYDDNEEMVTLVNSCRGVYDNACITFTCNRLRPFGCDDLEEVTAVNQACAGN
jgi:hypothetical protein